MTKEKTSLLNNSLLWFGAAISIAEILTGSLIAPLGFSTGVTAIVLGHFIGCILLYFAGLIGSKSGMASMESGRISFGEKGSYLFSILNILQLIGWTAVMVISGAKALDTITGSIINYHNEWLWCILIGLLIIIWIVVGIKNLGKLNLFAVGGLLVLCGILAAIIFKGNKVYSSSDVMSFGTAVELGVAMPLSWLPLIADYTSKADKPKAANAISVISYFIGSNFMYIIGLGAALYTGTTDISQILVSAGLGIAGVIVVLLSTVTTTFLDVYSAAISALNINKNLNEKFITILVCIIGTVIAMFTPIEQYQDFLYFIGSVFAPMITILITDYFILKHTQVTESVNISNIIVWIIGFIVYRKFIQLDTPLGSTVPVMIVVSILCLLVNYFKKIIRK
ncbi:putative hydroxymethylpyrimidine transporter CytX [Inconstantimicrobium mannanitabidum]|uniref:Hydrogenase expression protein n=1 Tax=Inconstantimicrobium mannanitabidum TaxID=1604901 RepID=A0ACB5R781_9CLOT|nr:putative hydroxymethylpyrimidine transporter CytX [Clostridium sp. TW13]GKX65048.1 hydrogenase expression protein [Clostridium sp. TW13]